MIFYIAQGIGFIGMAVVFWSFQQNDKRKFLWIQASANAIITLHFIFLGAFTGMGMNFIAIPRNLILAQKHNKRRKFLLTAAFIAAFVTLGIITWESEFSLLPICAISISTIGFSLEKPRHIRLMSLPVASLWLIYNIIVFSVAGALTESFCLCSILIAIFRFDILKRKDN